MTIHERPFGRNYEEFQVGDIYRHWPGKTITEYDDHLFCMITMNHHPLHTNDWYAEQSAPGPERGGRQPRVLRWCSGMSVPDVSGAAVANLEVETLKHAKTTFHGDTIYAETTVLDKKLTSKGDRGIVTVETKGHQPAGRGGVLLPAQGHGVEARPPPRAGQRPYNDDDIWPRRIRRLNRRPLLPWFARDGRDLPWRRTRDPWAVLVASSCCSRPRWRAS